MTTSPRAAIHAICTRMTTPELAPRAIATAEKLPLVAFSGWLASGKDHIARALYRDLSIPVSHLSFATAIRGELDELMVLLTGSGTQQEAATQISAIMEMPKPEAWTLCQLLLDGQPLDSARDRLAGLDAYQRTPAIRRALQYLGLEVRRAQDQDYWVHRAQETAITELACGRAFTFTDVRLPNEVSGLQVIGVKVIRLEISRATQLARLASRDGLGPDPAALKHGTETALDEYTGFDLVCNNEAPLEVVVEQILDHLAVSAAA